MIFAGVVRFAAKSSFWKGPPFEGCRLDPSRPVRPARTTVRPSSVATIEDGGRLGSRRHRLLSSRYWRSQGRLNGPDQLARQNRVWSRRVPLVVLAWHQFEPSGKVTSVREYPHRSGHIAGAPQYRGWSRAAAHRRCHALERRIRYQRKQSVNPTEATPN